MVKLLKGNRPVTGSLRLLNLVFFLTLVGCGGGSTGTGTGIISITGTVKFVSDNQAAPSSDLQNVTVTVVETGEAVVADDNGEFMLSTMPTSGQITLEIGSEGRFATTTISVPGDHGTLNLTLKVNPLFDGITVEQISMSAKIVGRCDINFENKETIRQANAIPNNTECIAKVTISNKDTRLAHVPVTIQYRDCNEDTEWVSIALEETMSGGNLGVAQLPFNFIDDESHCIYRILATFGEEDPPSVEKRIETFTYQARK